MKKILSTVVLATVMATSSFAVDTTKLYGGASLALENADGLDMGLALVLNAGLPVVKGGEIGPGTLAVEGEFTYSLMAPSVGAAELSVMTLGAYGAYIFDIDKQLYVKPRLGLIYRSYDINYGGDSSEIGIALGAQAGYKLDKQLDLIVGLNLVDGTDLTHFTAGVQYRF